MVTRHYNVPDADCIQEAKAVRAIYLTDEAQFTAFNPTLFSAAFKADWQTALDNATNQQTAETRLDLQRQETEEVLAKMQQARALYIHVKYFVELAFAKKPALADSFGLDDYETASASQAAMVLFLSNMYNRCSDPALNPQLVAAGLTPAKILEIDTLRGELDTEEIQQDAFIKSSGTATDERINVYNTAYEFWQEVARASKVIFYGNSTKLNEYKLPEGPQPDPDINLKGKVTDSANNAALNEVVVKVVELDLTTKTNYAGNYSFVSIPAGSYTLQFVRPGYTTQNIPITVLASGVVVQNVSLVVV
jgi:hypothetical protein